MDSKREVTGGQQTTRKYHVVALQVPIVFNLEGDHDHNGLIFGLGHNKGELDDLREEIAGDNDSPPLKRPHPLVRPLVLRAAVGETVEIDFESHIRGRRVGIHLIADRYDVNTSDGAHVRTNPSSLAGPPYEPGEMPDPTPRNERRYTWRCVREGVFPFHDAGNLSAASTDQSMMLEQLEGPLPASWAEQRSSLLLDAGAALLKLPHSSAGLRSSSSVVA